MNFKHCPYEETCQFLGYMKNKQLWNKIVELFCHNNYDNCHRYLRAEKGENIPPDLWPLENIAVSEILKELDLENINKLIIYKSYFTEFFKTDEYKETFEKILKIIENRCSEEVKVFAIKFFKSYYPEIFINNFNEDFFIHIVNLYEKQKVEEAYFDSLFVIFTSELAEKLYNWLTKNVSNQKIQVEVMSIFTKYNTLGLLFIKKTQKLIHELNIMYKAHKNLEKVNKDLFIDPLTKVYNRRFLEQFKEELTKRFNFVLFIDIDNFKQINDTFGHDAGDKILKAIGTILKKAIRKRDFPIRYGGDEFIIFLDTPNEEITYKVANRIKKFVEETIIIDKEKELTFTISIGISKIDRNKKADENIKNADKALYFAKREKNTIRFLKSN